MSSIVDSFTWPWWDTITPITRQVPPPGRWLVSSRVVKDSYDEAIRRWLANDEVISHSQAVGRSWCMDNSEDVDDLVRFLERAVRGVNAVLEGGIPSATGSQAVQEVEVS